MKLKKNAAKAKNILNLIKSPILGTRRAKRRRF